MSFGGQGQPQGQDPGAGQQNPMLRYYETWSATTPAVARLSIIGLVGVYLFSWLMDLSMYFANVPYYTIYSLELYRVVLSPLVGNSIMTVLIIFLFYPTMATRLENSMGSGAFLALLTTFSMTTNLVFLFLCFLMSILSSDNLPLFWSCQGFWTIIFPLMVVDCMSQPEAPRKFLCFPVEIPSKYFPLALYAFFMLLGGPRIDDLLAIGVGYAYSYGYLDKLTVSTAAVGEAEGTGFLKGAATSTKGWVSVGYAQGSGAWAPLAQADPDSGGGAAAGSSGGGAWGGLGGMMGRGGASAGTDASGAPRPTMESVFQSGQGQSLGGAAPVTKEEMAAQRLAALEKMQDSATPV